ncbi:putative N-acetyltransferase [Exophiala dermatitidis]
MALSTAAATAPALDAALLHEKRSSIADKVALGSSTSTSNNDGVRVRIVSPHEYKEAAACLAEAFRHDDVVRYAIDTPDRMHLSDEERFNLHKATMEYVTYAHCLNGLVLAVGENDNYDCVALWLPPGKNIDDWFTILRSGMWRLNFQLSKEGKVRFFDEFLPLLHRTKQEVLGDRDHRSWYLNYIGTKPEARGKGYARKLIDYVMKMADAEGVPCYLESSHDVNLIIYGKMGFELKKQIYLKRAEGKELRMDVMVREPVVSNGEKNGNASVKAA